MTEPGNSSETSLTASGMELVVPSHRFLTDIQGMTGCFTAAAIDCNTACTAATDKECDLFMHLAAWNEWLFPARLQLQEVSGAGSQLTLEIMFTDFVTTPSKLLQKSLMGVYCLLKSHKCIVALNLSLEDSQTWEDLLLEALKESSSVKYLRVVHYTSMCSEKLGRLVLSMPSLEKLEFGFGEASRQLLNVLSELLRSTGTLKVLKLPVKIEDGDASVLMRALSENSTVCKLSLNERFLWGADEECLNAFRAYMEKSVTLTALNYDAMPGFSRGCTLNGFLSCVLRNNTIQNLSLKDFGLDCESTRLLSELLETAQCLRSFVMTGMFENCVAKCCDQHDGHRSWILALAKSKRLKEVTLSMFLCSAPMWRLFLGALSSNTNTMKVNIEAEFEVEDVIEEFCRDLRESCTDDRVHIQGQVRVTDLNVLECKALWRVSVNVGGNNNEPSPILVKLPSCSHLTSVDLRIPWQDNKALFTAVAAYVETTNTLKELWLTTKYPAVPREQDFGYWQMISTSLIRNTSIREVFIQVQGLDEKVSELLTDTIKSRKNTWGVHLLYTESESQSAFIRSLSMGIANNFSLLTVNFDRPIDMEDMGDWFAVNQAVIRNTVLLKRSAVFAAGDLRDRFGAQALERVSDHGALPEVLMEVESVGSSQAAAMIRQALRSIEGMHDFMRLIGVVRERVVCLPRKDGRPQLDDLNEYCWSRVRRYLLLEDVRYSGRP